MQKENKPKTRFLVNTVKGVTLGISVAIPGLSAGTIAVAEKCYDTRNQESLQAELFGSASLSTRSACRSTRSLHRHPERLQSCPLHHHRSFCRIGARFFTDHIRGTEKAPEHKRIGHPCNKLCSLPVSQCRTWNLHCLISNQFGNSHAEQRVVDFPSKYPIRNNRSLCLRCSRNFRKYVLNGYWHVFPDFEYICND